MFFVCKRCGAQSPAGIGYAGNDQLAFPDPHPSCAGPHAYAYERMAALVMGSQDFLFDALLRAAETYEHTADRMEALRLGEEIARLIALVDE